MKIPSQPCFSEVELHHCNEIHFANTGVMIPSEFCDSDDSCVLYSANLEMHRVIYFPRIIVGLLVKGVIPTCRKLIYSTAQ